MHNNPVNRDGTISTALSETVEDVSDSARAIDGQPNPLVAVIMWELRRSLLDRRSWIFVGLAFLGTCLQIPINANRFDKDELNFPSLAVFGVTASYMLVLSVVFITIGSGLVSRDVTRRTHELLMSTSLPTWAFIWGRWLAGIFTCFALSLVALIGIAVGGLGLHLTDVSTYDPPNLAALVVAFAMIAPVDISLAMTLGFALGALFPRFTNISVAGSVAVWLVGLPVLAANYTDRFNTWLPVHMLMVNAIARQYNGLLQLAQASFPNVTFEQQVRLARDVGSTLPDLAPWLWQLSYVGAGLIVVSLLTRNFRRFQDIL